MPSTDEPTDDPTNRPDDRRADDAAAIERDGRPAVDPGPAISTILPVVELPEGTPDRCTSIEPGHNPHWIQARLAVEHPGTAGTLVRTPDGGVALRPLDGSDELTLRCHRPAALVEVLDRYGPHGWKLSYGVLVHPGDGSPGTLAVGICVATGDEPLTRCTR